MGERARTKVSWWMTGDNSAESNWSFVGLCTPYLVVLSNPHTHSDAERSTGWQIFFVVLVVAGTLWAIDIAATAIVLRGKAFRRFPHLPLLEPPLWLARANWAAGVVTLASVIGWLLSRNVGLILLIIATGLTMSKCWRAQNRRQEDSDLLAQAAFDHVGSGPPVELPFQWQKP